jgi:hypothetical protein
VFIDVCIALMLELVPFTDALLPQNQIFPVLCFSVAYDLPFM